MWPAACCVRGRTASQAQVPPVTGAEWGSNTCTGGMSALGGGCCLCPPGCWGIVLSRARLGSGGCPWGSRSSRRCARPGQCGRHGGGLPRGPECSSHPSTKVPVPPYCSWGPGAQPASLVTSRCAYSQGSRAEGGHRHEPDGPEEAREVCKPV